MERFDEIKKEYENKIRVYTDQDKILLKMIKDYREILRAATEKVKGEDIGCACVLEIFSASLDGLIKDYEITKEKMIMSVVEEQFKALKDYTRWLDNA